MVDQRVLVNLSMVGTKPTGIANYALNLVPALSLPHVTVLASQNVTFAEPVESVYPVPANLTPEQGKLGHVRRLWWTQFQIPRLATRLSASLLFSPLPEAPLFSSNRAVVMVHDFIPLRFPRWTSPLTPYFRYYVPAVLQQADHLICNSQATADDIIRFGRVSAKRITPIPLAHNANHFRVLDLSQEPVPTRPYFLHIGRPDPHKNLDRLIRAFAKLPSGQDYELWLAGSPDPRYTPALQAEAAELGLFDRVKFLDYVPYQQLPILLNQASALVFPSLWEGFGFPVLEAMACGTPVITSNCSSLPEVAGDAALLVDPYRETEIAAAMQTVISDAKARSQLRIAGLARAAEFSWSKTGAATRQILQDYL